MVDAMAITSTITAAKALRDIVKNTLDAKKNAKVIEATSELYDKVIELQTATIELQKLLSEFQTTCANLEREKAELNKQLADKESYRLHEIAKGRFVYKFEPSGESLNSPHYLCQPCYDNACKSVLYVTEGNNPYYRCLVNEKHDFHLYPKSSSVPILRG